MDVHELDLFETRGFGRRHVSVGGAPAEALRHLDGLPAYESESRLLHVMECLVVFGGTTSHEPTALPRSYDMAVARTQGGGMTALHDDPDAVWRWRPCLYKLDCHRTQTLGSQQELEYRRGMWDARQLAAEREDRLYAFVVHQANRERARYGGKLPRRRLRKNARKRAYREYLAFVDEVYVEPIDLPFMEARRKADAILREHLAPQQLLELEARSRFHVRGRVNALYRIDLGNGFYVVDPTTLEPLVSFCLHTEEWIPHADVALAVKLAIDSGQDGEAEILAAANPTPLMRQRRASAADVRARRLAEALYP